MEERNEGAKLGVSAGPSGGSGRPPLPGSSGVGSGMPAKGPEVIELLD